MRTITCEQCGARVSDQYSFCPNCLTPFSAEKPELIDRGREETETNFGESLTPRIGKTKKFTAWLGEANALERYFVYAFLLSIFLGIAFGFVNQTLYYMANAYLPRSTSAFDIFLHNFRNDLLIILTWSTLVLLSNFITFAAISGLIVARHIGFLEAIAIATIAFGTYGILEMGGHLCFGLIGFTLLERILLKKKTRLHRLTFFLLGTALLFVAALIEWSLEIALRKPR